MLLGDVWTPLTPEAPLVFTPTAGVLGLWDTTTLPNGGYVLRLIVNGVGGRAGGGYRVGGDRQLRRGRNE
jgi:hypothetical protein